MIYAIKDTQYVLIVRYWIFADIRYGDIFVFQFMTSITALFNQKQFKCYFYFKLN